MLSSVLQTVNSALDAIGVTSSTVQSMGGAPNIDPLGETYFSVTPFRYGDYVAKFSLKPVSPGLTELTYQEFMFKLLPNGGNESCCVGRQVLAGIIGLAPNLEILRKIIIGISVSIRADDPDLFGTDAVAQLS